MFTRNRCRIFPGIREGLLCGKGVEPPRGRGRLSGARESQLFFGVYYIKNVFKYIGYGYFVYLSCVYIYIIYSAGYAEVPVVLLYLLQINAWCITCCPKREESLEVYTE